MIKLATIRKVLEIKALEKSAFLEVLIIDKWKPVVVEKDFYKMGDKVIYIEINSFVPESLYPLPNKIEYMGKIGSVIKTKKIEGQISRGLVLPIHFLKLKSYMIESLWEEKADVSFRLGVVNYKKESILEGDSLSPIDGK